MQATKNKLGWKNALVLAVCGIAGSVIYRLPYLRETYYEAMQQATGSTNEQLGFLMSAYGLINFILYLPGGWAADKFSARKLMTFSLVITGLTGFYYATFPPYIMIVLLHGLWAITTVFTFWAVCVRIVRQLGDSSQQGKLYGFWYLGKGLTSMVVGFISVPLFSSFGEGVSGLRATIIFYSVICVLTGLLCWFLIPKDKLTAEKSQFKAKDMLQVLKMPTVWVAGTITFCMWSIYICFGMVTPYLSKVFQMSETNVALVSILRAYVLFAFGGIVGGILADKCKSKVRFMIYNFIGMIVFTAVYLILPGELSYITIAIGNMVALGAFIYCANAVFFSIIDEINIPTRLTGTGAGVISLMTYFSEIYLYALTGKLVDNTPGVEGFKQVFFIMMACAVVGLVAAFILQHMNKNKIKTLSE